VTSLDLHFLAPELAVGAAFPSEAAPRLAAELGISRVVDVRCEDRDDEAVLRASGILLLHLPTEDRCAVSQEMLRHGVAFVNEGIDRGERALVHCQYGIGRSALLALCVLVSRGDAPLDALERAKRARPVISPAPEQLEAFAAFAASVRDARGAAWAVPDFEAMADIAYRHLRAPARFGRAGRVDRSVARASSSRRE
jgi:predicted protein tyrosine phosphatase